MRGRTRGHVFGLRSASQVGLPAPVTSCQRSEAGGLVVPKSALVRISLFHVLHLSFILLSRRLSRAREGASRAGELPPCFENSRQGDIPPNFGFLVLFFSVWEFYLCPLFGSVNVFGC